MNKTREPTHKHDRILEIYNRFLSGEVIRKQSLADEYGVSERSIQRDIDSIRDFYSNHIGQDGKTAEIQYDHAAKGFRIIYNRTTSLTNAELFTVIKILMESRSLCKEELKNIILKLSGTCLSEPDKKKMQELIQNELFHYVEPQHGKHLVDTLWELGTAVYSHKIIHLEYKKTNNKITMADVKPVGIMNSEYYMYLIAYIGDNDKKHPGYPTIYRIDRIQSYKVTDETFFVPYRNRFEEGEFRKRIPFMYSGPLTKVTFIYYGPDIQAVLDRLPSSTYSQMEDGSYRVQAEVYGTRGIEMWLGSQGQQIRREE